MARRGRLAPLKPMRSTPDLAFLVWVLASVDLLPNLTQDFASLSMRPRTLGSLMNEEGGTRAFGDSRRPMAIVHTAAFMQTSPNNFGAAESVRRLSARST